jgi:hypothetical protein
MDDHQATWVRLREAARERFPDDDLPTEIATREAFDVEAQGVLDTARAATRLQDKLHNELWAEGSGAGTHLFTQITEHRICTDMRYACLHNFFKKNTTMTPTSLASARRGSSAMLMLCVARLFQFKKGNIQHNTTDYFNLHNSWCLEKQDFFCFWPP